METLVKVAQKPGQGEQNVGGFAAKVASYGKFDKSMTSRGIAI
jgi:hypothetical protein